MNRKDICFVYEALDGYCGLSHEDKWFLLSLVYYSNHLLEFKYTVRELAERFSCTKSAAHRKIKSLEAKELLIKITSTNDKQPGRYKVNLKKLEIDSKQQTSLCTQQKHNAITACDTPVANLSYVRESQGEINNKKDIPKEEVNPEEQRATNEAQPPIIDASYCLSEGTPCPADGTEQSTTDAIFCPTGGTPCPVHGTYDRGRNCPMSGTSRPTGETPCPDNGTPCPTRGTTAKRHNKKSINTLTSIIYTENEKPPTPTRKQNQPKRKKHRFPHDFVVTDDMWQWYHKQGFLLAIEGTTESWSDGMKAGGYEYVDWKAAWRNGMKKHDQWEKNRREKQGQQHPADIAAEFQQRVMQEDGIWPTES